MSNWSSKLNIFLSKTYPLNEENQLTLKQITLDGHIICKLNEMSKKYIENFIYLEILNMSSCKLFSLENLPILPNLIKIEINDNNLTDNEIKKLANFPKLNEIYAANNKISNLEGLKELCNMRDLHLLDLSDNPICKIKDYREVIFNMFPRLIFLDGIGKNNEKYEEFEDEEEEGEDGIDEVENEDDKNFIVPDEEHDKLDYTDDEEEEEIEGELDEEREEEELENPNPSKKKKIK